MQYEKKRNPSFVKKTRKYLKKNRFLLLNKFKKRIWLQKTDRDFYSTGCSFIQTVGNLRFSTENYKKPTEISISPRKIAKNCLRRAFLFLGIPIHQRKDQIFYFFEDFYCKKQETLDFLSIYVDKLEFCFDSSYHKRGVIVPLSLLRGNCLLSRNQGGLFLRWFRFRVVYLWNIRY